MIASSADRRIRDDASSTSGSQVECASVLFFQSQTFFGSDSMIHSLLMRYFDRSRFRVFAACNSDDNGTVSDSYRALAAIPELFVRKVHFGPTVTGRTRKQVLADALVGMPRLAASLLALIWFARRRSVRIIHGTEKPRDAFYGLLFARLIGARCVIHLHVKCEDWISPLVRWAMRHADAIVGVSKFVADSAIAKGYSAEKVHSVLNSIEASKWDPSTDGSGIRQEFGIEPDIPVLAIASRLFRWKGHTELLKALDLVKQRHHQFRLLIVGTDDPRADPSRGSYQAVLQQLAEELTLQDEVIFTGFRSDIQALLAACDIYAMPTFEEPCAVAFLEAMAMGKPIIALDSGGTPQLVDNGKGGFLSAPGDIEQLAENIERLLRDPSLRKEMGAYGRRRVLEHFTPQRMARDVEAIYASLIG